MSKDVLGRVTVHDAQGVVTDLLEKLGGSHGDLWLVAVKKFLRTPRAWKFPVWKTVVLGRGNSPGVSRTHRNEYRVELERGGHVVCQNGGRGFLLDQYDFPIAETETEVDLVVVTSNDLALAANSSYGEICARALEIGLELCPLEAGPVLRLNFKQRNGGGVYIAAKEEVLGGMIFWLQRSTREGSVLMTVEPPYTGERWGKLVEFVFVRPRP
jgi:hypothetical protein